MRSGNSSLSESISVSVSSAVTRTEKRFVKVLSALVIGNLVAVEVRIYFSATTQTENPSCQYRLGIYRANRCLVAVESRVFFGSTANQTGNRLDNFLCVFVAAIHTRHLLFAVFEGIRYLVAVEVRIYLSANPSGMFVIEVPGLAVGSVVDPSNDLLGLLCSYDRQATTLFGQTTPPTLP
jgi:hypothetical protein